MKITKIAFRYDYSNILRTAALVQKLHAQLHYITLQIFNVA